MSAIQLAMTIILLRRHHTSHKLTDTRNKQFKGYTKKKTCATSNVNKLFLIFSLFTWHCVCLCMPVCLSVCVCLNLLPGRGSLKEACTWQLSQLLCTHAHTVMYRGPMWLLSLDVQVVSDNSPPHTHTHTHNSKHTYTQKSCYSSLTVFLFRWAGIVHLPYLLIKTRRLNPHNLESQSRL